MAMAHHKGEPKRLRLRVAEVSSRPARTTWREREAGWLGLSSEKLLCLQNRDGSWTYTTVSRSRDRAGRKEQGWAQWAESILARPVRPTLAFPVPLVGRISPLNGAEWGRSWGEGVIKAPWNSDLFIPHKYALNPCIKEK
jgi:hypothetical protein